MDKPIFEDHEKLRNLAVENLSKKLVETESYLQQTLQALEDVVTCMCDYRVSVSMSQLKKIPFDEGAWHKAYDEYERLGTEINNFWTIVSDTSETEEAKVTTKPLDKHLDS